MKKEINYLKNLLIDYPGNGYYRGWKTDIKNLIKDLKDIEVKRCNIIKQLEFFREYDFNDEINNFFETFKI